MDEQTSYAIAKLLVNKSRVIAVAQYQLQSTAQEVQFLGNGIS